MSEQADPYITPSRQQRDRAAHLRVILAGPAGNVVVLLRLIP
jgi:hypothetical protein